MVYYTFTQACAGTGGDYGPRSGTEILVNKLPLFFTSFSFDHLSNQREL